MATAPSILLLQARRRDDPARQEELRSFALAGDVPLESIVPHDLLEGPPTLEFLLGFDAVWIGGAGEYYVSKGNLPHLDRLFGLLAESVQVGPPMFASCFGFQCLVVALGGEIVHDPDRTEVGTYPLELSELGARDELFGGLPRRFRAQLGRKDRAGSLPRDTFNLASSDLCPFQALRIPGRPVWASQFHPELDREQNLKRYERYLDGYAALLSRDEQARTRERFEDSPETLTLLRDFLRLVLE